MDDGKPNRKFIRKLSILDLRIVAILLIMYNKLTPVNSFDTEIESMREEGLDKHDISIFIEERVEYIHSRISLKPLVSGIEHSGKLSLDYAVRVNSSLVTAIDCNS